MTVGSGGGSTTQPVPRRLRRARDVRAVLASGRRIRGRFVDARVLDRGDGPPRVTVVAGRRVGSAVARNRAKRRLRAAARESGVPNGKDVVLIARPEAVTAPFGALRREVARAAHWTTGRRARAHG